MRLPGIHLTIHPIPRLGTTCGCARCATRSLPGSTRTTAGKKRRPPRPAYGSHSTSPTSPPGVPGEAALTSCPTSPTGRSRRAAELDALWEALASVHPGEILGTWRGTPLDTGHSAQRRLRGMRFWYGKRFNSPDDVEPLICRSQQGRLYPDTEASPGGGRLRMLPFRNYVTTALLYHGRPVIDYFKAADPATLMGIMTGGEPSDHGRAFYFILRRS
ncbi:hypothetical protein GCM10017687_26830 [Streptomyces echinatus]|uniref:GXWXG domain-containing protein n=1 Tax=Streptomyces echinatus TaxID=67293 RepID=UPI0031E88AB5